MSKNNILKTLKDIAYRFSKQRSDYQGNNHCIIDLFSKVFMSIDQAYRLQEKMPEDTNIKLTPRFEQRPTTNI